MPTNKTKVTPSDTPNIFTLPRKMPVKITNEYNKMELASDMLPGFRSSISQSIQFVIYAIPACKNNAAWKNHRKVTNFFTHGSVCVLTVHKKTIPPSKEAGSYDEVHKFLLSGAWLAGS